MYVDQSLEGVISSGMCIGCGACAAADKSVELGLNYERQIIEPTSHGNKNAAKVCPSISVDYEELEQFIFSKKSTGPVGIVDSVYLAQSTTEQRNNLASSGGLIKEVIAYLLDSNTVEGVVTIKHEKGLDYTGQILTSSSQVDELPCSIYHNISYEDVFSLIEKTDKKLGVVALPCQLEGVYNYIHKLKPELKHRVVFTIGLLCAWQYTRHSINAMGTYSRFDPSEVADVSYRGGGPIGKLKIKLIDDRIVKIDRRANINYQIAFDRYFNTPRCHVCVNHTNFLADLVVGDSWMQSTRFTKTGISIVIGRSKVATDLLRKMELSNRLVLHEVSEQELTESEGDSLVNSSFAYSLIDWLVKNDTHVPRMKGPNHKWSKKIPEEIIEKYQKNLSSRQKLIFKRAYKEIWWRKILMDGHKMSLRYLKWFVNRVLRLKKLTGKDKHLKRADLINFR